MEKPHPTTADIDRARSVFLESFNKRQIVGATLEAKYGPDFEKTRQRFQINVAEQAVIDAWLQSLKTEILAIQGRKTEPYYGATGGDLEYKFTGTSLGTILVVKEQTTGKELNITEALDWYFYG